MVKVNDVLFDSDGNLHKITYMTNHFLRWAISYNHKDFINVYIDFRIEEVERKINSRELIFYTKANWVLYGKK